MSNNFRYILTMQCALTKYILTYRMTNKDAYSTAKTLVEQLILKYGKFKVLKSDRGTEFTNELLKNICSLLKIEHKFASPYHHESLGSIERNHRVLNEFLLTSSEDHEWDKWLPYFSFAYNTTPHVDTGYSPFELVFGKLPDIKEENFEKPNFNYDHYATELEIRLKYSLNKARLFLENAKIKRVHKETNCNELQLGVGDLVLLKQVNRKKYQSPYKGPYQIARRDGVNSFIQIGNKIVKYHNNLLKPYKCIT